MTSNHALYKEFDRQLKTMISSVANNNHAPEFAEICNISDDENYVDVNLNGGTLRGLRRWGGKPVLGDICILVFIDGDYDNIVALCNSYTGVVQKLNKIPNGRFQMFSEDKFRYWTGGVKSDLNYWFDKSTARILPEQSMTSDYVTISDLKETHKNETVISLLYYYLGAIKVEIIDYKTKRAIKIAPESLNYYAEILEPVEKWHYARTTFLLRDIEKVCVKFTNVSKTESAYIDGIRLWTQDFDDWYPSDKD